MMKRLITSLFVFPVILIFMPGTLWAQQEPMVPTKVVEAAYFDVTPPLRDMEVIEPGVREREWKKNVIKNHMGFQEDVKNIAPLQGPDPLLQDKTGENSFRSIDKNFEGVNNLSGVAPPDTDGDVGPDHYMQMVNLAFAIYDKNGNLLYGPADNSTIWDGFIGSWTGTNDGDPIVLYDEYADRWMASQFAINTSDGTQWELVAISATGDPTGSWYRYAFQFDYMPDYPKLGIWPDGYYISVNQFQKSGGSYYWKGAGAAVMNRDKMLAGDPTAEMVFFNLGTTYSSLLPADADGTNLPPAGSPNYFTRFTSGALQIWALDVDWNNTSNSSLTMLPSVSVATFSNSGFSINQPGTSTTLDDLADRLMYRLQYRNFGTHQAMVTNHTVNNGSGRAAVRWYELRNTGSGWTLYQQGTYGPNDGNHRWMGSIAMNAYGDIGLGYSVSGSSTYPSIRFTGRNSNDPLGQMTVAETSIFDGTKSQTGVSRWGDYSCMSVDPVNQSTFWFTTEYSNGGWSWRTRVASFDITPPNALFPPQNLTADVSGQTVTLNWNAPLPSGNNLLGYNAYRNGQIINASLITSLAYPDDNVPFGFHEYEVTAVYSEGSSISSNTAAVTVGSPEITVDPASYSEQLNPGQTSTRILTIGNTGELELSVSLETEFALADNTEPVVVDPEVYQQMVQNRIEEFGHKIGHEIIPEPADAYCVPSANCSWGDGFTDFSMGNINNANSGCSSGGYGNFTSMSTDVEVGTSYSVTFRTGYSRQYVSLWIDFNENEIFETTERLLTDYYLRYSNQYYTTQITIPADVENGEKRMRIRANWQNSAADPCSNFSYGETEDYTVLVGGGLPEWLTVNPVTGTVSPGSALIVDVNFNAADLALGTYQASIWVSSNDPDNALIEIPVTLQVVEQVSLAADFEASAIVIFAGESIDFTDLTTGNPTVWNWEFEGAFPSVSSEQHPAGINYDTPGTYNVSLTASNAYGSDTETKADYIIVNVVPLPEADFQASATTIMAGESIDFTDLTTNNPTSWNWTFEGGTPANSAAQNPTGITYDTPGTYNVSLTASNAYGSDTEIKADYITVNVVPLPEADFQASTTTIMAGESIDFTDLTTNDPTAWNWTFEGGTPANSAAQNPTGITYDTPGTYNVSLTASNAYGSDTETKTDYITVNVVPLPEADFQASATTIMAGESIDFTDLTTNNPTAWNWTFEGGTPGGSVAQNPIGITYDTPGTYNVSLTASNAYGSDTEIKADYITVNVVPLPEADFQASTTTIMAGESIDFTDLTTNNPTSWNWTFEGGTPANSAAQNPTGITYDTPGTYNVSLTASNAYGSDTETKTDYITVNVVPLPEADFQASATTIMAGESIDFTDLTTNNPTSWNWTFEGGTPANSAAQNPTGINYNTPGTYNVTLTASNAYGSDTETKIDYITVNVVPLPEADFQASATTIMAGESIDFTDLTTNDPTSWNWTFEGGTPANSAAQNPTGITYDTPGTYNVSLTASNAYGSDTETKADYITVNVVPLPEADFQASTTTIMAGESIDFTDLTTNNPTSWNWTFDGGTPANSAAQNPTGITYDTPGTYNVSLTASNAYGSDTETKADYITINVVPLPEADFQASATTIMAGESIDFTDLTTNNPTSWNWTFGGGTPGGSVLQNPTGITYDTPGTYNVSLTASNAYGSDTETKADYITVNVVPLPEADFQASATTIMAGESIDFTDLTTNDPTSWNWTFDGGTPGGSVAQNPTGITYDTPGTYNVSLTASNAYGSDTETKADYITVNVVPLPEADFQASATTIMAGESIDFTDLTTNDPTAWNWTFDGGTPGGSVLQNPTGITYDIPGTYNVSLTASNAYGSDTETKADYITVNVVPLPEADFQASATTIMAGESIDFTDLTTNNPTSWNWTFDGGTPANSAAQNPIGITYNTPGIYNVSLTTSNVYGSDTETKTDFITVIEDNPVVADFTADKTLIEEGEVIHFTDLSSGNPTFWKWQIQGATPSVSYMKNPVVIFNTPGIFDVKLFVSGINGQDELLREDFIEVTEVQTGLPPGWEFSITSTQHAIAVPLSANPRLLEEPIAPGDFIGVFYEDQNGQLKCGGASEWNGEQNVAVVAYGNESLTPGKEGFSIGEEFTWRIYSMEHGDSYHADATYDGSLPNQGTFFPMGMSALTDLSAGVIFEITIPGDWSGISSPVSPWNPDLNQVFGPVLDQLVLMYDSYGVFWPSAGVNTIGNWGSGGYNVKMTSQATVEFTGNYIEDLSYSFNSGWSYLPVPVPCDVNVAQLFQGHQNHITMVREISGYKIYWPAYGIATLQQLKPGKAYMMLANTPFTLDFEPCAVAKTSSDPVLNQSFASLPWKVNPSTSVVHTIGFAESALSVLKPGDIIGIFNTAGNCYGAVEYTGETFALSAFGDDPYSDTQDGFKEGEFMQLRLYRPSDDAVYDLEVNYSSAIAGDGYFETNGVSVVNRLETGATASLVNQKPNVSIYPNPGDGLIVIAGISEVRQIEIINPEGQVVFQMDHDGRARTEVDLRGIEKGVYFIRMTGDNFSLNRKLVVN